MLEKSIIVSSMHNLTAGKVRMSRIEYKGKGKYIEEILK